MLRYPLHQTVIRIRPLMQTLYPFKPRIFNYPQRNFVFLSQFLQFAQDTISYVRNTLGIQTIHHILYYVQFILNRKVDKVCIDQNVIRGPSWVLYWKNRAELAWGTSWTFISYGSSGFRRLGGALFDSLMRGSLGLIMFFIFAKRFVAILRVFFALPEK